MREAWRICLFRFLEGSKFTGHITVCNPDQCVNLDGWSPTSVTGLKFTVSRDGSALQGQWLYEDITIYERTKVIKAFNGCAHGEKSWRNDFRATRQPRSCGDLVCVTERVPEQWRPGGGAHPAMVKITAHVDKPEGARLHFRFSLSDISSEKGYAMNAGDNAGSDLMFIPDPGNHTIALLSDGGFQLTSMKFADNAALEIKSLDYGAWGRLKAESVLRKQLVRVPVRRHILGLHHNPPRRESEPHCRFLGKERASVGGKPASSDEDIVKGLDKSRQKKGDGFSIYEESRGFLIRTGGWISTSPQFKDLFLNDEIGCGAGQFYATNLEIHFIKPEQYGGNSSQGSQLQPRLCYRQISQGQKGIYLRQADLDSDTGGRVVPNIGSPNFIPGSAGRSAPAMSVTLCLFDSVCRIRDNRLRRCGLCLCHRPRTGLVRAYTIREAGI